MSVGSTAAARDVVAGFEGIDETWNVLGLVPEVTLDGHDDLAASPNESGVECALLPEPPLESHGADAVVRGLNALEHRKRVVH